MGCFFGCFRFRDADRPKAHLISKSISSKSRDPVVTKNHLASVLLYEEKGSTCDKIGHFSLKESFDKENADEDLKREAKFLKSCGALLETPAEIRKASKETMLHSSQDDVLPSTSCRKLHWDEQPDQVSAPAKAHGSSNHQENESGGCKPEEHESLRKAVQFEEVEHVSSEDFGCGSLPPTENQIRALGSDDSPHPTRVNLRDEMQTPETGSPLDLQTGVDATIGTQANFNQVTSKLVVPGLSEWLKPPPTKEEIWNRKIGSGERSHSDKSTVDERPIIGIVAAHWNDVEPSHISPKWFDGNGIPNSTNKYKEDQKVSWHATPFEERLEKALSEDKSFPPRGLDGRPINFEHEDEESDTAAS